jgi:hypothetical protein
MTDSLPAPQSYPDLLSALKERIRDARLRTAIGVNRELIVLYWEIGRDILLRQSAEGWGTAVIDRLARDLPGFPRHDRPFSTEPEIYAGFRRGVAGPDNRATARCTTAVGS